MGIYTVLWVDIMEIQVSLSILLWWLGHGVVIGVTRSSVYSYRFYQHFFSAKGLHTPIFRTSISLSGIDGARAL
jgi:hypothetical protein